jgi:hypothetical protein
MGLSHTKVKSERGPGFLLIWVGSKRLCEEVEKHPVRCAETPKIEKVTGSG